MSWRSSSPAPMAWPLPIYELALMTARRGYDSKRDLSVTIVDAGGRAAGGLRRRGKRCGAGCWRSRSTTVISEPLPESPEPGAGRRSIPARGRRHADRVIALPELFGPIHPRCSKRNAHGFIPIDMHCRVRGLDRVFAAGDATEFAIKQGGMAAQQADVAAQAIAALAGAPLAPSPSPPRSMGSLLGGEAPVPAAHT